MTRTIVAVALVILIASGSIALAAPAAPTNLTAVGLRGAIELGWHDNSADEIGFLLARKAAGQGWSYIARPGANAESYADSDVATGVAYSYLVCAQGAGFSAWSNLASAAALPNPPAAPSGLQGWAMSCKRVDLEWLDASDNELAFHIERALAVDGPYELVKRLPIDATGWYDTSLAADTRYYYRVCAWNRDGQSAYSHIVGVTTPPEAGGQEPPPVPSFSAIGLVAAAELTWRRAGDDWYGYELYREDGGLWDQIAWLPRGSTGYTDSPLPSGTVQVYAIRVIGLWGYPSVYSYAFAVVQPMAMP